MIALICFPEALVIRGFRPRIQLENTDRMLGGSLFLLPRIWSKCRAPRDLWRSTQVDEAVRERIKSARTQLFRRCFSAPLR